MRQDKALAQEHGVPKAFRQYAGRYGDGIEGLLQDQKKYPVGRLDHGGDKRRAREAELDGIFDRWAASVGVPSAA